MWCLCRPAAAGALPLLLLLSLAAGVSSQGTWNSPITSDELPIRRPTQPWAYRTRDSANYSAVLVSALANTNACVCARSCAVVPCACHSALGGGNTEAVARSSESERGARVGQGPAPALLHSSHNTSARVAAHTLVLRFAARTIDHLGVNRHAPRFCSHNK
jgi:hypothetical protein